MAHFRVNEKCNGCLACVDSCPAHALSYSDQGTRRILLHSITRCARCGHCWRICPQRAIEFDHLLDGGWDEVAAMDLIRCSICGAPIYTTDFRKTLLARLGDEENAPCPHDRSKLSLRSWHQALAKQDERKAVRE